MAAITRTLTRMAELPKRSNSRSCKTRSNLGCSSSGMLPDLVEKERSRGCLLRSGRLAGHGARERALLVAEESPLSSKGPESRRNLALQTAHGCESPSRW